jgi:hypothetical protein
LHRINWVTELASPSEHHFEAALESISRRLEVIEDDGLRVSDKANPVAAWSIYKDSLQCARDELPPLISPKLLVLMLVIYFSSWRTEHPKCCAVIQPHRVTDVHVTSQHLMCARFFQPWPLVLGPSSSKSKCSVWLSPMSADPATLPRAIFARPAILLNLR